jgi:hypothetical protein
VEVSDRLTRWVTRTFPDGAAEQVLQELRELPPEMVGGQDCERVQAALVLRAQGDWHRFLRMRDLARQDWRDALVAADLADDDWRDRLAANLDP